MVIYTNVPYSDINKFGIICPGQYLENVNNTEYEVFCFKCSHAYLLHEMKDHVQEEHGIDVSITCPWCVTHTWNSDEDELANYQHVKNCELCLKKNFTDKSMGYAVFFHLISCLHRRCFNNALFHHWDRPIETNEDLAIGYCVPDYESDEDSIESSLMDYDSDSDSYSSDDDDDYFIEGVAAG
jgi:hypothetical protein